MSSISSFCINPHSPSSHWLTFTFPSQDTLISSFWAGNVLPLPVHLYNHGSYVSGKSSKSHLIILEKSNICFSLLLLLMSFLTCIIHLNHNLIQLSQPLGLSVSFCSFFIIFAISHYPISNKLELTIFYFKVMLVALWCLAHARWITWLSESHFLARCLCSVYCPHPPIQGIH